MPVKTRSIFVALALAVMLQAGAHAQEATNDSAWSGPLKQGPYLAPMLSYILTDDEAFDDGIGGTLAAGYRQGWWAVEGSAVYGTYGGAGNGKDTEALGGTLNGLVFPMASLPNLFGLVGAGGLDVDRHPVVGRGYSMTTFEGGLGYLWGLAWGRYEFGVRTDARYRYGKRHEDASPDNKLPIATDYTDTLLNIGLQLPLSLKEPSAEPAPVEVVAAVTPTDSDRDGVTDNLDQCPGTPERTVVDEKGCPLVAPACKPPAPGERVSIAGCGTGDVITLKGVTFESNQARLTPGAKAILDEVGAELKNHPGIAVEIGGHTDGVGSDDYNQRLSESRARSVLDYLSGTGVAASRMTAVGYGEAKPVADNSTAEGREVNRRVELKIASGTGTAKDDEPEAAATSEAPAEPAPPEAAPETPPEAEPSTEEPPADSSLDELLE